MLNPRVFVLLVITALFIPSVALADTASNWNNVESVVIYPASAKITVSASAEPVGLPSGETVLITYLPGYAVPSTLSADIDGRIAGMNVEQMQKDDPSDPILAPWKQALLDAQAERDRIQAEIDAANARIEMWTSASSPNNNVSSELEKLDQAMQKGVKTATDKLLELGPQLEQAEKKVEMAETNLNALAPSYKVTFILSSLRPGSKFTYTYLLHGCGWQPAYTLNALPDEDKIDFGFSAEVYQTSGFDWTNIDVSLATNAPRWDITPPNLDYWQLGRLPEPPAQAPKANERMSMDLAEEAEMSVNFSTASGSMEYYEARQRPVETQFATYSIWQMGKKTILNDQTAVYSVMEDSIPAKFLLTARPKVSAQAFLTAELDKEEEKKNLPPSSSVFMVEGNTVGTAQFPPSGDEPIFFGTDPLIVVNFKELSNQADERGFIGKTQVRSWHWKMEVQNKRKTKADIRIEDSIPSLVDARIELKMTSAPMPTEDKEMRMYIWEKALEPGADFIIEHKIEASAPTDVNLDSNR